MSFITEKQLSKYHTTVALRCQCFLADFRVSLFTSEFPLLFIEWFLPISYKKVSFLFFLVFPSYFILKSFFPVFFSLSFLIFWVFSERNTRKRRKYSKSDEGSTEKKEEGSFYKKIRNKHWKNRKETFCKKIRKNIFVEK